MIHPLSLKSVPSVKRAIALAIGICVMATGATGLIPLTTAIAGDAPQTDPMVVRATLPNGLHGSSSAIPSPPWSPPWSITRWDPMKPRRGFPGMAHAQEHMMFRGSPGLTAGQLADINAAMGGMFDADTQQTVTQYFFTVPAEYLDVALHIEAIRMRGVLDSDRLWQQERGAIEQEVARDLSSPNTFSTPDCWRRCSREHPMPIDALGTKASFDATTGAMLKNSTTPGMSPTTRQSCHRRGRGPRIGARARSKNTSAPSRPRNFRQRPQVRSGAGHAANHPDEQATFPTAWCSWRFACPVMTARIMPPPRFWQTSSTAGGAGFTIWRLRAKPWKPAFSSTPCPSPVWALRWPPFPKTYRLGQIIDELQLGTDAANRKRFSGGSGRGGQTAGNGPGRNFRRIPCSVWPWPGPRLWPWKAAVRPRKTSTPFPG